MALSSSALKSITNRPKRIDLNSQLKDSTLSTRPRTSSISSRQKNTSNTKVIVKSNGVGSKKNPSNDIKSETTDSSNGASNTVGSLTSSPKWSHIKNKFENGTLIEKNKLGLTTSLPKKTIEKNTGKQQDSKSLNLLTSDVNSISCGNTSVGTKGIKKNDSIKTDISSSTNTAKLYSERRKTESSTSKSLSVKDKSKSRCSSPKSSYMNIPIANTSNLHSSTSKALRTNSSIKVSPLHTNNLTKTFQSRNSLTNSSISLSSTSSKNSELDVTVVSKSGSVSPKPAENDIPSSLKTIKNVSPKSSLSNVTSNNPMNSSKLNSSALNIVSNSTTFSKKSPASNKSNFFRLKQKHDDKPILNFNQQDTNHFDNVKSVRNKQVRKSFISDEPEPLHSKFNDINLKSPPSSKQNSSSSKSVSSGYNNESDEKLEKIQNLIKSSQTSSKTVWIKNNSGNWTKKEDSGNTISQSKVASLRSKFLEPNNLPSTPLTKSVTTSNVPSKSSSFSRPLAKSSTTSSICDKTFIGDFKCENPKLSEAKTFNNKTANSNPPQEAAVSTANRNSLDSDASLNIVQRAILNFEGNLVLLSPESQKRLKLVNEKVQAQTDDNKILKAKKNEILKTVSNNKTKDSLADKLQNTSKPISNKVCGEPLLPTRSFLTRYQLTTKKANPKDSSKTGFKSYIKNDNEDNVNKAQNTKFNITSEVPKKDSSVKTRVLNGPKEINIKSVSDIIQIDSLMSQKKETAGNTDSTMNNIASKITCNDYPLQPNPSFLWCRSRATSSDLSKSSTTSSVSLTSSDYKNYYDVQNYYSTLDLEIEKNSDISEEPIYIDSQESTSSDNNYTSTSSFSYQNIPSSKNKNSGFREEWTDMSDDDFVRSSISSNQSSTLKRRRNKRNIGQRETRQSSYCEADQKRQITDTISFTDSSDTLINDEVENESTYDLGDSNHFYEPVYESLGNYLLSNKDDEDDNCSISLSPDDRENGDIMQCSLTSLESAASSKQDKEEGTALNKNKSANQKKTGNKISQIKRHLSWTKNDIRLELSSKSNKIKVKNGETSTEIGVKVQEHGSVNTSPKKKTFIKCILRQKSASSIPLKRSPSPKKESALFYVHLTMGREKQRPFSDSIVTNESSNSTDQGTLKARKQSEPSLQQITNKTNPQRPRFRKVSSGPRIQRPKTPPPLPPMAQNKNMTSNNTNSTGNKKNFEDSSISFIDDISSTLDSHLYTCLDPDFFQDHCSTTSTYYENNVFLPLHSDKNNKTSHSSSKEDTIDSSHYTPSKSHQEINGLKLSEFSTPHSELLKSPFEEEPMYQFYQRDVQQRATLGYSADVSESEFEDDASSKFSDIEYQTPSRPPVLQSQLSAMDLVHGEGGQRTLWCEVPEVVQSGILKEISSNDRKIQEAMFEVITSEASYLKSLNFLMEHFVQCSEFSGSQTNVLDKRERHVLFSDIQPVRDVSVRLLADLEKRWLENIVLSNICDIVYHHASNYFSVYVKYCSNQLYQERTLKELKEKKPEFVTVLKRLECSPICQGLDMHSFLMLPMQRITRLPLLIDAIFHRLSADSPIYDSCKMALATVNKLVAECNEGARKMGRMEEMLVISQQLDFKDCKGLGLLSASRWLVKKGELVQLILDSSSRRTFGRSTRWCKIQLYLFLFTDLLVVTRKKSDESYSVVDFCPRNMLEVLNIDENMPPLPMRLPSSYRNIFRLTLLHNKEGKESEIFLSCLLESDRTRWMDALTPAKSENPDEKIYEKWECKQVQCIHVYNAQQPDELSLEEADVVNVFRKITGWFEGERIRDGVQGWFPCSHVREIVNSHVIARNLHQRYRLLMLSRMYLEEQYKVQASQSKK